eukprot:gene47210-59289_t
MVSSRFFPDRKKDKEKDQRDIMQDMPERDIKQKL